MVVNSSPLGKCRGRWAVVVLGLFLLFLPSFAAAEDISPPPFLQWFEASYETMQNRTPDVLAAGYGAIWIPPVGRGDNDKSVGYDVYDRFDLGTATNPTLYGTEDGIKSLANTLHRATIDLHVDFIINHNGAKDASTKDNAGNSFAAAGGFPGFVLTLPNFPDGDFNSPSAQGEVDGRLLGLIDFNHRTNFRFIRNPVPGFANNIPAGTQPAFGRLANVPNQDNLRFYPDQQLQPIVVFDPETGEQGIKVYPFNLDNPKAGDPAEENAMGYLMRNSQWLVQVVGIDGFRIDAAKHVPGFALDFFDRAVYRANPRKHLNGETRHVFSYSEVFEGDHGRLMSFVKKSINPSDPGRIGANRDVLDFPHFFRMREELSRNGINNHWGDVVHGSLDFSDDGLMNGSTGVKFVASHDEHGPDLSNVAHAYTLMLPGNAVVYHNAKEFGPRDFPKDGRGDALGGVHGNRIKRLIAIRNTHGRGDFRERWLQKELFAFERRSSAVVLLSNRLDQGFDSRTLSVDFAPGTPLIELTGNASDPAIDPHDDLPELVEVNNDRTINVRFPRNTATNGNNHNCGYLIYGLAVPMAPDGIQLTGVDHIIQGATPSADRNGVDRLSTIHVVKGNEFTVRLQTVPVNLLGSIRDVFADGDNALLRIDAGVDVNGSGSVDSVDPDSVAYGFEQFRTKHSPLIGSGGINGQRGDGEFTQTIDATKLAEGIHFIEVRAFRHRTDNGPAVFSRFTKAIKIERGG